MNISKILACAVLIVACYFPSIQAPFYFDDSHSIVDNLSLRNHESFLGYWSQPELSSSLSYNRSYRPLSFAVYHLLWQVGEGSTVPFHLYKMFLLLLIAMAIQHIGALLWTDLKWPQRPSVATSAQVLPETFGWMLAFIWSVHPALSEATIYITATSSLQSALFYLWGFWLAVRNQPTTLRWFGVSLLYAASFFSKEEGVTLPAVIALYYWIFKPQLKQQNRQRIWASILGLAALGVGLFALMKHFLPEEQAVSRGSVSPFHYFLTQIRAWLWYQRLWVLPIGLNADNLEFGFSESLRDPRVWTSGLVQMTFGYFAWRARSVAKGYWFCWIVFYIAISPASSLIPLAEPVNERRMITAYAFWSPMILAVIAQLWTPLYHQKKRLIQTLGALILIVLGGITHQRAKIWADPLLLWKDTAQKNPSSPRALNNLASIYITQGSFQEAYAITEECRKKFQYLYCWINSGIAAQGLKKFSEAKGHFEGALQLNPNLPATHYHFALFWMELNETNRAIEHLQQAQRFSNGMHAPSAELLKKLSP